MIKLLGIKHKNTVIFEDAYLPLDHIGVTQIRGENKDSKTGALKDPNAAGKSVLVRPVPEIIFASSPLTEGIKTKARKDLFTNKDSAFCLDLEHNDKVISVTKSAKGKSFEYIVEENSRNIKVRRKDYTEAKIRELFGYTEDEFYTQWYIDSRRISPLQIGGAAKRLQFFTKFFRLDDTDETRKIFLAMLREAKLKKASYDTLLAEMKELGELNPNIDKLRLKYKELRKEKDDIVAYIDKLKNDYLRKTQLLDLLPKFEEYKKAAKIINKKITRTNVKKLESLFKQQIKNYEQNKTAVKQLAIYDKEIVEYELGIKKLKDANKVALEKGLQVENVERKVKELGKKKHKLEEKYKKIKNFLANSNLKFDKKRFQKLKKKKLQPVRIYEERIQRLEFNIELYEGLSKQLCHTNEDSICPLCTTTLSSKDKSLKDTIIETIKRDSKLLEHEKGLLKLAEEYKILEEKYVEYKKVKKQYDQYSKKLKLVKRKYKKICIQYNQYTKLNKIQDRYANIRKPAKPDLKNSVCKDDEYFIFKAAVNNIGSIKDNLDDLLEINVKTLRAQIKKLEKKLNENSVQKISDKFIEVSNQLESEINKRKKHKRLVKKIEKLQTDVDDIPVLETLVKAFSNKGFKLVLIQYLASKLEKNLNKYAPLLYSEKIKFHIKVNSATSFDLLAERKVNGSLRCSDVHTLSGAESRAFSFLLPLAMIPLIPENRRLNVMILDEPLQNMGEARKDLFINSFIPKLRTLIPHIVILSTDNEYYKNSKVYYVVKEKSKSKLVEAKYENP